MQRILTRTVEMHHPVAGTGAAHIHCCGLLAVAPFARSGGAHGIPALATDAFHFASDIWSTLAVLSGLGASWIGSHMRIGWLRYADPFAAVVVSLMILRMTLHLGRETVAVLMDEVPVETRQRLVGEVEQVEGVLAVEQARVRRAGAGYFADLTLALPRRYTFEHTEELVRAATDAVHRALPTADVVIHTVPREPGQRASSTACAPWLRATT